MKVKIRQSEWNFSDFSSSSIFNFKICNMFSSYKYPSSSQPFLHRTCNNFTNSKMAKNSVAFFAFLLLLFVLAISEIGSVKGELCEKASKTWSGNCGNTRHCDDQCKSWEGAAHGACHVRDKKHMCFCYFNCPKAQKLAQDKQKAEELAKKKIEAEKVATP